VQLNFGGQTAALPEESISNPGSSVGHKTQNHQIPYKKRKRRKRSS